MYGMNNYKKCNNKGFFEYKQSQKEKRLEVIKSKRDFYLSRGDIDGYNRMIHYISSGRLDRLQNKKSN